MISALLYTVAMFAPSEPAPQDQANTPGELQYSNSDGSIAGICPLKGTTVNAKVEGFGARVIVLQKFTNPTDKPIEAVYTFPLPQDSAVDGMRMVIGKRIIDGVIMKREEAKEIYNQAKQAGKSAALLDQERPNLFTQSVANIPPGAEIQVALTYVQVLKYEEGEFEFVYPMVVAKRFLGSTTPDPGKVSAPIVPEGTRSGSTIDLNVEIDAGAPITSLDSKLHKIDIEQVDARRSRVKLAKADEIPNRDFILRYGIGRDKVTNAFLTYTDPQKGGFFTLIMMPPKAPKPAQVTAKEAILVIDQSGSQTGRPIVKSKELSYAVLDALNPNDTFNVVSFNVHYKVLWNKPRPNTARNRAEARKFIGRLEADGGTHLEEALAAALQLPKTSTRPRVVIFNTDGLIGGEAKVCD